MKTRNAIVGGIAVAMIVAAPATANRPQEAKSTDKATVTHECDGGEVALTGDLVLWPPNHKYSDYDIVATADNEDDNVELATQATHDEFDENGDEINGAGNTTDDASPAMAMDMGTGSAMTEHDLRSERSGRGDGRTYTINYEAQFGDGEPCMGEFTIEVPHDMRSDNAPPKKDQTS